MSGGYDIRLLGAPELDVKLRALPVALQKGIIVRAAKIALAPVLTMAKALCPVSGTDKATLGARDNAGRFISTGGPDKRGLHLRDTLKIVPMKSGRKAAVARIATGTRAELGISADDPYYYPMAVEVGTSRAPAHPFLRPALRNNEGAVRGLLATEIGLGIESAARSGGGA